MQFLDPHVASNCYHCITKEEQEAPPAPNQMIMIGSTPNLKVRPLEDDMSPYIVVDDISGEHYSKMHSSENF